MLDNALALLRENQRFVLSTHIRPDGDALGSEIALARFLEKMGKDVTILNSDLPANNLEWLAAHHPALEQWTGSLKQREAIAHADVIVILDTNALQRLGKPGQALHDATAPKLLIDHHLGAEDWFDAAYARTSASSTGELVYELIAAHDADLIDADIATALYAAIMTDTGSFRYSSVTPAVHRIIADLLDRGDIAPEPIHIALFDAQSLSGLRLLGLVIGQITIVQDGKVAYTVVTQDMLNSTGARLDETEGFVNYALSIEGVEAALIFLETPYEHVKISFRSKGDLAVNKWAAHFGGGGHRNAAGAFVKRPLRKVLPDVMEAADRFLPFKREAELAARSSSDWLSPEDAAMLAALRGES